MRDEVPYNKKEKALEAIHRNDYDLTTMSDIISKIRPTDGADWTRDQRERFHLEIFRNRKNLKALCTSMGVEMENILGYYLGKYKTSNDYRLLKTVCAEERIMKAESFAHEVDECAACGDGGSLLICDGCESEWHMGCTKPALKTVPEGFWLCDICVDRSFLAATQQIIQKSRLFVPSQQDGGKKRKLSAMDMKGDEPMRASCTVVNAVKRFARNINEILTRQQSGKVDVTTQDNDMECALSNPKESP
jgi:PHD-finger